MFDTPALNDPCRDVVVLPGQPGTTRSTALAHRHHNPAPCRHRFGPGGPWRPNTSVAPQPAESALTSTTSTTTVFSPAFPGEPLLCLPDPEFWFWFWFWGVSARVVRHPAGVPVRPELVPVLDDPPEGTLPAGPSGQSRAWESVHPPGLTQYSTG